MTMQTTPSSRLIGVIREAYGLDLGGPRRAALLDCLSALDRDVERAADEVLRSATRLGELVECATNNETYFFRHVEQLVALRALVAESLAQSPRPSLRVWVAGCSSGEEALSIAAMLREPLRLSPGTSLSVLGTDLHGGMIRKAGTDYTMWSFRGVPAEARAAHFVEHEGRYRPRSALSSMVRYRRHNLFDGPPEAIPFDVVSCRNVLIYFDAAMVKRAIELLSRATAPGGLLLLGPAESAAASLPDFEAVFHEGVAMFRRKAGTSIVAPDGETLRARPRPKRPGLASVRSTPEAPRGAAARTTGKSGVDAEAQVAAALAALERGDADIALERLRAVIAADEDDAMAHYLVGSILEARGEHEDAERFYRHALAALGGRAPSLLVPCGGGITVDELMRFLSSVLQSPPARAR